MTSPVGSRVVRNIRNWKLLLALGFFLTLCSGLCMFWYWQRIVQPPRLTSLHGQEFVPIISTFEAMEYSLGVQLHPEQILSVATKEYLERHLSIAPPLNCTGCDRFWVTTSAEASRVCVLDYSVTRSIVRASVKQTGHRVSAGTYEPLSPESAYYYRSTYDLIKEGVWKVTRVTGYVGSEKGSADPLGFEEYFQELGCR